MFTPLAGWLRRQRIAFSENAAIGPHLHFKIGGPVRLLVFPSSAAQLAAVLRRLAADPLGEGPGDRLPYLVIGGGSNIVFGDEPTRAVVLLASAAASGTASDFRFLDDRSLQVGSGVRNQPFLSWCTARGAGGLEFLSGIPGTLGGAAAVNAGAFGRSLADVLLGGDIIDESGCERAVDPAHFGFRYRESRFKFGSETLLALRLRFRADNEATIAKKVRENLEYRRKRHPSYRLASAGCFFKNPLLGGVKTSAGKITEECGLKKTAVGDLVVAEEHGNFLLNRGRGTFSDLCRLEESLKETVAARTGVVLEREVIYVSPEGEKY
jgi:UDP-N-acetylenolpyruvoylglucosamine reductase